VTWGLLKESGHRINNPGPSAFGAQMIDGSLTRRLKLIVALKSSSICIGRQHLCGVCADGSLVKLE
jgi:hypothetical protein